MTAIGLFGLLFVAVIYLGLIALMITSMWKIYAKANQPGWASIIPVYNLIVFFRVIQRPKWWLFIYLGGILAYMGIALFSFILVMENGIKPTYLGIILSIGTIIILALSIISIMDTHRLSKAFGNGVGFTLGLLFLPIIFIPILAFGDARYVHGGAPVYNDNGALDSNL